MAVFERIDLALVHELLETAAQIGGELPTVNFVNQPSGVDRESVPDACINGRFAWWFETKIQRGLYSSTKWKPTSEQRQIKIHSENLRNQSGAYLIVLTPDTVQPSWFGTLNGIDEEVKPRIVWVSFRAIVESITALLQAPRRLVAEQTRMLLSELIDFYEAEGLLTADDTVVVAARTAWEEYLSIGAYVCQPNRSFRDGLTHLGFYHARKIETKIPRIVQWHQNVRFSRESAESHRNAGDSTLAKIIEELLNKGTREEGVDYGVMVLTSHDDTDTRTLVEPIRNDTVTSSGRPWAWTLGQRYTQLSKLCSGLSYTSELDRAE